MKHKVKILWSLLIILALLPTYIQAEYEPFDEPPRYQKCNYSGHKEKAFEQRIKKLKEEGIITEQEEKELLDAINDVKTYKEQVWSDDKLTKEEQQNLLKKQKNLKEKMRAVLDKARQQFMEDKTPQEREKIFNERIDKLLKDKKISEQQADKLKKQHKELLQLEEKIWSDGVMTKEEQQELFKQKQEFHKQIKKFIRKEFKCKTPTCSKPEVNYHE